MLEQLKGWVQTVIIATHDMQLVADWANRVIVLHEGNVIRDTDRHGVFHDPDLWEEAAIRPPQIVELGLKLGIHPVPLSVEEFVDRVSFKNGGNRLGVL